MFSSIAPESFQFYKILSFNTFQLLYQPDIKIIYPYLLNVSLVQSTTVNNVTIERFDLFAVIFGIGSLLFIMRRLSFKIQNSVVKFNIDNSLMKQLFVVDKPQAELA